MSANEVLLPPWVIPQAESTTLVDDSTSVFRAAYAPGNAQRVGYVDPRLQVKQTFQGLRSFERGAMLAVLKRARGKLLTVRAIVGYKNRGSFPTTELFANSDFSLGTTSWGSDTDYALTALDHAVRATRAQVTASPDAISQGVTRSIGVPYAVRFFINGGKGSPSVQIKDFSVGALGVAAAQGMLATPYASPLSVSQVGLFDSASSATLAGNYFDVKWSSFSRCALVDNGFNLLLNSDSPGTGTGWSLNSATASANGTIAPDGTTAAWQITEAAATTFHAVTQAVTVGSSALDYSISLYVAPGFRPWCFLQMNENLGATGVVAYFNVSTGAIGTITTGANWSNASAVSQDYGNGWKRVTLTARKTNASTAITMIGGPATANGTNSYLGISGSGPALQLWRASFAQSSVPVKPVATTSAQALGTSQIGNSVDVKGLPASTIDLLLEDDLFEINGELKSAIAPLSSDSAGLGTVFFAPSFCRSPADGDAVIINKPMGKFILAADSNWTNNFGVYADSDITLEAINE